MDIHRWRAGLAGILRSSTNTSLLRQERHDTGWDRRSYFEKKNITHSLFVEIVIESMNLLSVNK